MFEICNKSTDQDSPTLAGSLSANPPWILMVLVSDNFSRPARFGISDFLPSLVGKTSLLLEIRVRVSVSRLQFIYVLYFPISLTVISRAVQSHLALDQYFTSWLYMSRREPHVGVGMMVIKAQFYSWVRFFMALLVHTFEGDGKGCCRLLSIGGTCVTSTVLSSYEALIIW